jgi:hypothetical protein
VRTSFEVVALQNNQNEGFRDAIRTPSINLHRDSTTVQEAAVVVVRRCLDAVAATIQSIFDCSVVMLQYSFLPVFLGNLSNVFSSIFLINIILAGSLILQL